MIQSGSQNSSLYDVVRVNTASWLADLVIALCAGLAALLMGADEVDPEAGVVC